MAGSLSYVDVKSEIVGRIRRGEWTLDTIIPGEIDLAAELGCARATVNRALRELAQEGVVERRRKAGTRVIAGLNRSARIDIPLVRTQIERSGAAYRYHLVRRVIEPVTETPADHLGLASGRPILAIDCIHFADERPHQFERRWINLDAVPAARDEPFETIGPNEWLVRKKPLSDAEHVLSAANATNEEAEALGLTPGDAVFVIERRTWLADQTITFVRLFHAGTSFRLKARVPETMDHTTGP